MAISPALKRKILDKHLATETGREKIALSMQRPFQFRFEKAIELLQHWEDDTEERIAFMIAKKHLDEIFSVFEDHEFVREREEVVRMCPWGSSDLIDVEELLATFSWYKGPMAVLVYKFPADLGYVLDKEKAGPTPRYRIDKNWAAPDLGLRVTWPEREREPAPEISPRSQVESKMKIRLDVSSD